MKPEAQRITIAEACGWSFNEKEIKQPNGLTLGFHPPAYVREVFIRSTPDYLNDFNAIREACLWAIDNLWDSGQVSDFAKHLESRQRRYIFGPGLHGTAQIIIRSTAEDWCYAFLKTSNLWTND